MVIYYEDEMYGFIDDIIYELKKELEERDEEDREDLEKALETAKNIKKMAEYPPCIYKCWYNPMGAFVFQRLVEEDI